MLLGSRMDMGLGTREPVTELGHLPDPGPGPSSEFVSPLLRPRPLSGPVSAGGTVRASRHVLLGRGSLSSVCSALCPHLQVLHSC